MPPPDDEESVSAESNDPFLELYDRALPEVYGYLLHRCGDVALAEDLTSEVFLAAARSERNNTADLALPWLINVGDMLGHIPLPAKITIETLPPIHLREEFGPDPDVDVVYDHVLRLMQDTLDALAAERRLPVLG